MRQGQHKNRSRSRGRRPGNSVNRVYESNGPDVKVRGTAQTVAEKYLQLARDAASSGDIVKAESFYQHAKHYLRIVAASQTVGQPGQQGQQQRRSMYDDDNDDDGDEPSGDGDSGADEAAVIRGTGGGHDGSSGRGTVIEPVDIVELQPQPQPARGGGDDDGNAWDGHQPDFLRRGAQPNGAPASNPRARRERRPRTRPAQPELAGSEQPQIVATDDDGDKAGDNN